MRAVAVITVLCGCSYAPARTGGTSHSDATVTSDGTNEACFGIGLVQACPPAPPVAPLTLGTQTIDTSDDGMCTLIQMQSDNSELCVVVATEIVVNGTVTVIGKRPFVLAATSFVTIEAGGTIDVSSTAARTGAGANYTAMCSLAPFRAGSGEGDSGGGGGGAGGGFGTRGANGGVGDDNDNQPPSPHKGVPGLAGMQQPAPTVLRGGCPGGAGGGGLNDVTSIGPEGGASGGAVYVIANETITIAGNLFASGAGGRNHAGSAGFMEGGGGGGSGGMIGLAAPAIAITGIVAANGGAGSGGGDFDGGNVGQPGTTTLYDTLSTGGSGAPCCGAQGGSGAAGAAAPTEGGIDISGGGGGGGGAGVVWIDGVFTAAARISPAPSAH